jgi:hypothetical protein
MSTIFSLNELPNHLFSVPELDFSGDLLADRLGSLWFRLGAWSIAARRDERNVEEEIMRQSLLIDSQGFVELFDRLDAIGNVIGSLGKPGGAILHSGQQKGYSYLAFHQFELHFDSVMCEPLVFIRHTTSGTSLFINPDLYLYFELEEKNFGSGIWWDPKKGVEALTHRVIDNNNLIVVDIRTDYLQKYLQARQMSLLVGHYRQLLLFDPSPEAINSFVKEDVVVGSIEKGAKAILNNWGLRNRITEPISFLQRRLHLWVEIKPLEIDIEDPWSEQPSFDPYTYTLPTKYGVVAPARWTRFRKIEGRTFEGATCDFMSRVYFRQDVLSKYEGSFGFEVEDDGSVRCSYWGLTRSTARLGNELISTAIGDFAEGVPFEEWQHWRQYAVEPPTTETMQAIQHEQTISEAVNSIVNELQTLNISFASAADLFGASISTPLWNGSLNSLAGRQLKWFYPSNADDDEFLKRATLLSTLVLDELLAPSLRKLLNAIGKNLDQTFDQPPKTLGSRNLLQRLTLIANLIEDFTPSLEEIPTLIKQAENKSLSLTEASLRAELKRLNSHIRNEFAPLAYLYELRTYAGLAHPPDKPKAEQAAGLLGLPRGNWHRTDYLRLLDIVAKGIKLISNHIENAVLATEGR